MQRAPGQQLLFARLVTVFGALAAARLIRGQLYGVGATDPVTLLATSLLLVLVACVAGLLPARRAAQMSPMTALRQE